MQYQNGDKTKKNKILSNNAATEYRIRAEARYSLQDYYAPPSENSDRAVWSESSQGGEWEGGGGGALWLAKHQKRF